MQKMPKLGYRGQSRPVIQSQWVLEKPVYNDTTEQRTKKDGVEDEDSSYSSGLRAFIMIVQLVVIRNKGNRAHENGRK